MRISNHPPKDIPQDIWEENTHPLIDMLRHMIRTEPESRSSADELLGHGWFKIAGLKS
jgi:serine/threonine protein kinase